MRRNAEASAVLPAPSPLLLAVAEPYLRRYAAKHFDSVRIALDGPMPALDGPTVLYANHASWWDPVVILLLIRRHYPDWRFHGPIDASALRRYPWLERLGLFGIEPESPRGAARFLDVAGALLHAPQTGIAMTAQGRFADVRERPVTLKRGLAVLMGNRPDVRAIPLAIEYVFWNERLPEVLVRCGQSPVRAAGEPLERLQARLESGLEHELDLLARDAVARDPCRFERVIEGRQGVGWLEDLPLRMRALARGRRFDAAHSAVERRH
ncbi:MAG: lysophospholipid acyltransferase family protein [Gammaproteobacteria bacterium]|nr:lysophospholipid acyltransferase family protein [Gammaproteobacteria bacterium]